MDKKNICPFFLKGICKFGEKCKNAHILPQNQSTPSVHSNHNICKFFLMNSCKNENHCKFFHGFGDSLMHIKTIENVTESQIITNLVKMDNTKYIISDEQSFIVRFAGNDEEVKETLNKEEFKIGKMIYSNNKVIFGLKKEG